VLGLENVSKLLSSKVLK